MKSFDVCGVQYTAAFQKCVEAANHVNRTHPELYHISVIREMPQDYTDRVRDLLHPDRNQQLRSINADSDGSHSPRQVAVPDAVVVSKEDGRVHDYESFLHEIQAQTSFRLFDKKVADVDSYEQLAQRSWLRYLHDRGNSYCWMTVQMENKNDDASTDADKNNSQHYHDHHDRHHRDGRESSTERTHEQRITFELYSQLLPRTCHNFSQLCVGVNTIVHDTDEVHADEDASKGKTCVAARNSETDFPSPSAGVQNKKTTVPTATTNNDHIGNDNCCAEQRLLCYKNTTFFRVLKDAWVMGGDVSEGHRGEGGYSCYGRYFPDESFAIAHDKPGVLGMCNDGPHTNSSSFYITHKKMSWMNGHYVAFGRVIDGMSIVDAIFGIDVKHNQSPKRVIRITDCGVLDVTM